MSIITVKDMANALTNLIEQLRNGTMGIEADQINVLINELTSPTGRLLKAYDLAAPSKKDTVEQLEQKKNLLIKAYKTITSISLQLQKLIPEWGNKFDHTSLDYAFYAHSRTDNLHVPYYTNTLSDNWLSVVGTGRKAQLKISLTKATNDLAKQYELSIERIAQQEIQTLLSIHYTAMRQTVSASYERHHAGAPLGSIKGDINFGHVAEAHEHIVETHHKLLRNYLFAPISPEAALEDEIHIFKTQEINTLQTSGFNWYDIHSSRETWDMILQSLGWLRGTVAGDIGTIQVKSTSSTSDTLNLTSVLNLRVGWGLYSKLFDKSIPASTLAKAIALYITDIIDDQARAYVNKDILPAVQQKTLEKFEQYSQKLDLSIIEIRT